MESQQESLLCVDTIKGGRTSFMCTFTFTPGPPTTMSPSSGNSTFASTGEVCVCVWCLHINWGPKAFYLWPLQNKKSPEVLWQLRLLGDVMPLGEICTSSID